MECEIRVDGALLEEVSEFKYYGYVLDESGTDVTECCKVVVSERRVAGAIRSMVNGRSPQLERVRVLHEALLVPFLLYSSEEKRSEIRDVQLDNLRGLLGVMRMDRVLCRGRRWWTSSKRGSSICLP